MIIAAKRNDVIVENEVKGGSKMHINAQGEAHIIRMLTKAYADPIGSIVRESVANAKDSHTMANQENPVIVRIKQETEGNYTFEVEDFGLGLDDVEFDKYIMGIGESTKQQLKGVIGGYGIGSKSSSSYCEESSYFYTCFKDGIERKYMIFSGENTAESTLLYQKETERQNGVIVSVPIKNGDIGEFENKICEQLAYFSNVYFENCGDIDNDFKIYRGDLFQWSELCNDNSLHISLDDVYYPIDYNKLGISRINTPVALKFSIEEGLLTPIPNRESIEYNKSTKEAILNKIKQVAEWFIDKYNETNTEFTTISEVSGYFYNTTKHIKIGENYIKFNDLLKYSDKTLVIPKFKDVEKLPLRVIYDNKDKFLKCYNVIGEISYSKYTGKTSGKNVIDCYNNRKKLILCNTIPSKKKLEYIKETIGDCYFIAKRHSYSLGQYWSKEKAYWNNEYSYVKLLGLYNYPKSDWRQIINEWILLEKLHEDSFIDVNSIEISKEWENNRKSKRCYGVKNQKLEGEINFKFAEDLEKSSNNWNCKFVSKIIQMADFHKTVKKLVVYGLEEDRKTLDRLWQLTSNKNEVHPAIVGDRDYKKLQSIKIHNLITIKQLMEEYHKPIVKYVTAYKISKFYDKYNEIFKAHDYIKDINSGFAQALVDLKKYKDNFQNDDNELMKSLEIMCDTNKWYDYPIYQVYQEVSNNIDKIDFLKFFIEKNRYSYTTNIPKEAFPIIKELLLARKFKMDYTNYPVSKPIEVLEEELVEQD